MLTLSYHSEKILRIQTLNELPAFQDISFSLLE